MIKFYGGNTMKKVFKKYVYECTLFRYLLRVISVLLISISFMLTSQAQDSNNRFWLDLGLGFATAGGGEETRPGGGASLRVAGHFQFEKAVISVPLTINGGGKSNYDAFLGGKMRDQFNDVGLLVGYAFSHDSNMQLVISSGISRVGGSKVVRDTEECWFFCNGGKSEDFEPLVGIPIEVGLYSLGRSAFGLGLTMHININRQENFAGFSLNVMIGDRD